MASNDPYPFNELLEFDTTDTTDNTARLNEIELELTKVIETNKRLNETNKRLGEYRTALLDEKEKRERGENPPVTPNPFKSSKEQSTKRQPATVKVVGWIPKIVTGLGGARVMIMTFVAWVLISFVWFALQVDNFMQKVGVGGWSILLYWAVVVLAWLAISSIANRREKSNES